MAIKSCFYESSSWFRMAFTSVTWLFSCPPLINSYSVGYLHPISLAGRWTRDERSVEDRPFTAFPCHFVRHLWTVFFLLLGQYFFEYNSSFWTFLPLDLLPLKDFPYPHSHHSSLSVRHSPPSSVSSVPS